VEVDFTQFSQVIDLLGGISMELRQDEADAINATIPGNLTAGEQWLSGSQALAYARIRNLDADGDFSRTDRQRKVIYALFRSYKDADLGAVLSLISEALPMITTDMSKISMLRYAAELFPVLAGADFVSQQIPAAGTYSEETIRDMAVLVADMDAARKLLQDTLLASTEK
jgi:anionic cell wall polymer biosynthesis LytR-Cps2A-Psr (LCP) family protein